MILNKKVSGKHPLIKVGDVFETRTGSKAEVVHYESSTKVWVQFLDDVGYVRAFEARDLKRGVLKIHFNQTYTGRLLLGLEITSQVLLKLVN